MNFKLVGFVLFSIFIFIEKLGAQEEAVVNNNIFYVGLGSSSGGEDENDDMTWSVGFLADMDNDSILGFDIAGEGTMLDSTYGGYDDLAQGMSYNLL